MLFEDYALALAAKAAFALALAAECLLWCLRRCLEVRAFDLLNVRLKDRWLTFFLAVNFDGVALLPSPAGATSVAKATELLINAPATNPTIHVAFILRFLSKKAALARIAPSSQSFQRGIGWMDNNGIRLSNPPAGCQQ